MSDEQGVEQPQGTSSLEERVETATAESTTPEPAAMPTAPEEKSSTDTNLNQSSEAPDQEEVEALEGAKNPERTRKYIEKLKGQLKERGQASPAPEPEQKFQPIFDQFRQPAVPNAENYDALSQQQVNSIAERYVDSEGNVDIEKLNQALMVANQRAAHAEQNSQKAVEEIRRYEESRQLKEAYEPYPQLDPKHKKFDPDFYELVSQKIMVENYAKGGNLTLKEAADYIAERYRREPNVEKAKEEAVEEYKRAQEKRNQGPVERGRGQSRESLSNYDDLRNRSRHGDNQAIAKRLADLDI